MAAANAGIFVFPAWVSLIFCAFISGLRVPAHTAAKKILERILEGPDLLKELRPLNTPDSLS
jgi:hypothetical protein